MSVLTRRVTRALAGVLMGALALPLAMSASVAHADEVRERQYWLEEFRISEAWSITRGAGVTIAIIDTGVDGNHEDLRGAVVGGTDVSGIGSPDGQTPVGSSPAHGTMVASLAAGRGHDGGDGVIGSAPGASVLSVSMSFGNTIIPADEQIAEAVIWAVDNGADVISLSLTRNTREWPVSWDRAFGYAEDNDVVVVAAAGNRSAGTEVVGAPATMPGVLTVGGVDRAGVASARASSQGITIGVMAPSENLVGALPGEGYALWAGTSGATPIVSGIAALVRAAHPELDAANVVNRILATARPVTPTIPDPLYGFGLIDAYDAVAGDVPLVQSNPLGTIDEWVQIYRRGNDEQVVYPLGPVATPEAPDAAKSQPVTATPEAGLTREIPLLMVGGGLALVAIVAIAATFSVLRVRTEPLD
ncbi:S8 family serine peptidase [Pontimonas sp.]|uniref:S8 family peptidase n=1 Tax=Pontimonas sp. TaxID=2304492 RepID=UPI00287097DD|nr:S8 family serine peptidase [Pontimonas sp.]MDR9396238.1 S8 family serine peptidase [Pontimonas sp.]MDR9434677.1 S8 family serine peptidase [Pontimonas sp.]